MGTYLTACATFGMIAGKNAAKRALDTDLRKLPDETVQEKIEEVDHFRRAKKGVDPCELRKKIQEISGEHVGCERSEAGLKKAIQQFEQIMEEEIHRQRINNPADLVKALESRSLCLTGRMIAEAGLRRKETSGQHRRVEYPESDQAWLKWLVLKNQKGTVKVREEKIPCYSIYNERGENIFNGLLTHCTTRS